jgi:hypothetical protein
MPTHVLAGYWAVLGGTFDTRTREVTAQVALYPDEAACAAGAQPLEPPITLTFSGDNLDAMGAPELQVTQLLHALVQTRAPFAP